MEIECETRFVVVSMTAIVGRSEVTFANGQKVARRYLTVWQRQPAGAWKIFRNVPVPDDAPQ